MAFYSGKSGVIKIGATALPLTEWSMDIKTSEVDVTNFTSGGWRELIDGIFAVDISASGPYNGASLVTQGTLVSLTLDVNSTSGAPASFTGNALVTSLKIDTSVKDAAKISYTMASSGAWTVAP